MLLKCTKGTRGGNSLVTAAFGVPVFAADSVIGT